MAVEYAQKETVLVVDNAPHNLLLMNNLLKETYRVKVANTGEQVLKVVRSNEPPDLILLDLGMPGIDSYELCRQLKQDQRTRAVPIIFVTDKAHAEGERLGLAAGAADYLSKPISAPLALARIKTQLNLRAMADFLHSKADFLEREVNERMREIVMVQDVTILAMASLSEMRDSDTGNHIRRTQNYVKTLAEQLKNHPRFADFLTPQNIDSLFRSAPLHDIGKVCIPDRILLKPGRLTATEFNFIKRHTTLGAAAILQAEQSLGAQPKFLKMVKEIILSHQEKWDGSGYPEGLSGEQIPISARLMAVADVYDALISRRVYKDAMPHEKAVAIIIEGQGRHFDPDVVDAFIERQSEFAFIARTYVDTPRDLAAKIEYLEYALAEAP